MTCKHCRGHSPRARLKELFDFSTVLEFTVEAGRPDTITQSKLEVMKKHGVEVTEGDIASPQLLHSKTAELMAKDGKYAAMFRRQAENYLGSEVSANE